MVRLRSTMATFLRSLAAQIAPFWPAGPLPMTTKSYSVEFMHELAFEAQPPTRALLIACEDSGLSLTARKMLNRIHVHQNKPSCFDYAGGGANAPSAAIPGCSQDFCSFPRSSCDSCHPPASRVLSHCRKDTFPALCRAKGEPVGGPRPGRAPQRGE